MPICPYCADTGDLILCTECNYGHVACPRCDGTGFEKCWTCDPDDEPDPDCEYCNDVIHSGCSECGLELTVPCPKCRGRWSEPCPYCEAGSI